MDVWTLNEKLKDVSADMNSMLRRIKHIEDFLGKLNTKLEHINKVSNYEYETKTQKKVTDETVQDKKSKPSSVRARRSTTKKSKSSK